MSVGGSDPEPNLKSSSSKIRIPRCDKQTFILKSQGRCEVHRVVTPKAECLSCIACGYCDRLVQIYDLHLRPHTPKLSLQLVQLRQ